MSGADEAAPGHLSVARQIQSPWRVDGTKTFTAPPDVFLPPGEAFDERETHYRKLLRRTRKEIRKRHKILMAGKQFSVLMIFQALDAAGKDGAIREVLKGLDPGGVSVAAFKRPSLEELAHDFLWRTSKELPRRGSITAFNRSYYEEVLAVRVHPEFLDAQFPGGRPDTRQLWKERFASIRAHERHLLASRTVVLKFWLNVSPGRQARRFLDRLEDPAKHWKFSSRDVLESGLRTTYDKALSDLLNNTSTPDSPWFCIPADNRWFLRAHIADLLLQALSNLPLAYPEPELPRGAERHELNRLLSERVENESAR